MEQDVSGASNAGRPCAVRGDGEELPVLRAVELAAKELSPEELRALGDEGYRNPAARWRSNSGTKKISAALARMMNALKGIKSSWVEDRPDVGEIKVTEALPLATVRTEGRSWWKESMAVLYTFTLRHCKTMWLLVILVCFPKLVAALLAMVVRLLVRFCTIMVMRLVKEVVVELDGVLFQLSALTSGVEQAVVQQLEIWMTEWLPSSRALLPGASEPAEPGQPGVSNMGGTPPPQPPSYLFTNILLALNVVLTLRSHRGGVGGHQGGA